MPDSERKPFTYHMIEEPSIEVPHITVQIGWIDDIMAERIYYKDRLIWIKRGSFPPYTSIESLRMNLSWDIINPYNAVRLRKECLRKIVENLFYKKYYDCYKDKESSLFVHKKDFFFIIELNAYFHDIICGEAEIARAINFYDEVCESSSYTVKRVFWPMVNPKFKSYFRGRKDFFVRQQLDLKTLEKKPKLLLITSGDLRSQEFLDLIQQDADRKDFDKMVFDRYTELQEKITNTDGLDDRVALDIYRTGIQKWQRFSRIPAPKMYQLQVEDIEKWEVIVYKTDADIVLIPSEIFYYILQKVHLWREVQYFDLLQNTSLEELMIEPAILGL
ncbi:hypothetical protein LCGC14_1449000 [marine sediment metagenome]|uniref:Uncharacterized protein n=1 Tax=marine sediment metagenome TaxID=412755 RepID=A0A0F9JIC0_9ZZZZ